MTSMRRIARKNFFCQGKIGNQKNGTLLSISLRESPGSLVGLSTSSGRCRRPVRRRCSLRLQKIKSVCSKKALLDQKFGKKRIVFIAGTLVFAGCRQSVTRCVTSVVLEKPRTEFSRTLELACDAGESGTEGFFEGVSERLRPGPRHGAHGAFLHRPQRALGEVLDLVEDGRGFCDATRVTPQ